MVLIETDIGLSFLLFFYKNSPCRFHVKFYLPIVFEGEPKYKYENAVEVEDDIEDVKTMDFGLVFGAGINIGPATIDARYNLGLTTTDDSEDEFDVKNSVISIMLGYSF